MTQDILYERLLQALGAMEIQFKDMRLLDVMNAICPGVVACPQDHDLLNPRYQRMIERIINITRPAIKAASKTRNVRFHQRNDRLAQARQQEIAAKPIVKETL
ncbi:MAG TPA: hypothetical protein VIV15_05860, partial [Anaerolineales bacterium]